MKLKELFKKFGVPILVCALAVGGIAGYSAISAFAAQAPSQDQTPAAASQEEEDNTPDLKGTIAIPEDSITNDAQEAALGAKATITKDDAINAAKSACPEYTVGDIGFGEEDGYLVYEIDMVNQAGDSIEVKVDAGNAKNIKIGKDDSEDDSVNDLKGTIYIGDDSITNDSQEAALGAKATISKDDAIKAAKSACPEYTVGDTGFGEEDGYLVYEVDMLNKAGDSFEVKIDAGNAKNVKVDKETEEVQD